VLGVREFYFQNTPQIKGGIVRLVAGIIIVSELSVENYMIEKTIITQN